MQCTGAKILMECLVEQGVDTIFGYPGGTILNVYDELYNYEGDGRIKHIVTRRMATHVRLGASAYASPHPVPAAPTLSPALPRRIWIPRRLSASPATSARPCWARIPSKRWTSPASRCRLRSATIWCARWMSWRTWCAKPSQLPAAAAPARC